MKRVCCPVIKWGFVVTSRWSGQHVDQGGLLSALLAGNNCDQKILEFASDWLHLVPFWYEQELYDEVDRAYAKAKVV